MSKLLVEIQGFDDWLNAVKEFADDKGKKRKILFILRKVAKPTLEAAKRYVPVQKTYSNIRTRKTTIGGSLRQSLGYITGRSENPTLYVGPRVFKGAKAKKSGRNTFGDGWYGHMVDQGHNIYRNERYRSYMRGDKKGMMRRKSVLSRLTSKYANNTTQGRVEGRFFMKSAYESTKGGVTSESESSVALYLQKRFDRIKTNSNRR